MVREIRKAADLLLEPDLKTDQVAHMLKARLPSQRYWAVLACLYRGEHLTRALDAELGQLLRDPSRSVQIAAAEALATHPRDEQQRSRAIKVLLENSDPTASSAYHAVAALNALDHQPQAILKPLKDRILKLPTSDPNAPGRSNGYAGRMHKHIATPIPDYFPWERK